MLSGWTQKTTFDALLSVLTTAANLARDKLVFARIGSTGHNPATGAVGGEREIQGFPEQLSLELTTQYQTNSHCDVAIQL